MGACQDGQRVPQHFSLNLRRSWANGEKSDLRDAARHSAGSTTLTVKLSLSDDLRDNAPEFLGDGRLPSPLAF
jgi:hypothetical protein